MSLLLCAALICVALVVGCVAGYNICIALQNDSAGHRARRRDLVLHQMRADLSREQLAALRPHVKLSDLNKQDQDTVIAQLRGWYVA